MFLAMNRRGQEETGGELGAFCVNCHAPMAVHEDAISDFAEVEQLPAHLQGVTCYFCHNAVAIADEHVNAQITLADDRTMRASLDRALIPSVHGVARSSFHDRLTLDSSRMCGTCHDIVTSAGVHLERTLAEYEQSFFARPESSRYLSCQSCHMDVSNRPNLAALSSGIPGVDTQLRDTHEHLFPGVDLPLTAFPGADALRRAVEGCQLPGSVSYFTVTLTGGFAPFTVQIEMQAGHAQPSGASQDRRMWLEVTGYDQDGTQIYSEGVIADGELEETPGKRHPCMFRDRVVDARGEEAHMFWDADQVTDEGKVLPIPKTATQGGHTAQCAFAPALSRPIPRLEFQMRMRPIGLDVLQDLVDSGHLSPDVVAQMPTLTVFTRRARYDPTQNEYLIDDTTRDTRDCHTYKCMLDRSGEGECESSDGGR